MAREPKGRARIHDVAEASGVSIGTVSRVLNNHPDVSPTARLRVQQAVERLDYRPSAIGRALSRRTIDAIGVLVPDLADPVFLPMIEGIETVASRHGHAVLLANSGRRPEKELQLADLVAQFHASGAVLIGGSRDNDGELARRLGKIPAVVIARLSANDLFPSVGIDHRAAARAATGHLLDLGHRRIGLIRGDRRSEAGLEREGGYLQALGVRGLEPDPSLVAGESFELRGGVAATQALLDVEPPPTAIVYSSDELALGGLRVIKDRGFRVPQDISVVGLNDIPYAATTDPPLTTVRLPARDLGTLGMQQLVDIIEGRGATARLLLSGELVVRASSGPPRAAPGR